MILTNFNLANMFEVLTTGAPLVVKTDTVPGIIVLPSHSGVDTLFNLKKRPANKPLIWLVSNIQQAYALWGISPTPVLECIFHAFWPGALTIVMPSVNEKAIELSRSNDNTVGVRIPNDIILLHLLERVGAVLSSSANISSQQCVSDRAAYQALWPDIYVDTRIENNAIVQASSIISYNLNNNTCSLIREGNVSRVQIDKALSLENIEVVWE